MDAQPAICQGGFDMKRSVLFLPAAPSEAIPLPCGVQDETVRRGRSIWPRIVEAEFGADTVAVAMCRSNSRRVHRCSGCRWVVRRAARSQR